MTHALAQVWTRAELGLISPLVKVEVHISNGLPSLTLVGLPESAVRESKDRVRSAILSAQADYPTRRVTINLAPADLPKQGGRYDLPIAIGLLAASGQVSRDKLADIEWVGELGLDGQLRPIAGILPIAMAASESGRTLVVPQEQLAICAVVPNLRVLGASHLSQIIRFLSGEEALITPDGLAVTAPPLVQPDLIDVRGQAMGKRALEIAAAGGHSLLFVGPPGSGKSMLASRMASILPPLSETQRLASAAIHSLAALPVEAILAGQLPFQAPHHSASAVALVGGGSKPRPGAISIATHGILFLDELPEFDRRTLEMLREPLESGEVRIARAAYQATYPAQFMLIAAMNPSPSGYFSDDPKCHSTPEQIARYLAKISGPLLDRIDCQVELPAVEVAALQQAPDGETSAKVAERVAQAREIAAQRGKLNAALTAHELDKFAILDAAGKQLLAQAMERFGLSARSYHRILRVGRSIADLAGSERVQTSHLAEALSLRALERRLHKLGNQNR
ncbi:MAG: YifB family Mg chelatase-like AAA ATPase [Thiotrichales bacterium]|jgi:magnesium chelatase family protein|nr:YifB family Mg chelatase-like AAA ATPase [Thiotrichales bacterium]